MRILDPTGRLCDGLSRREWLRLGTLAAAGLTGAPGVGAANSSRPRAKSCILLCLLGGPPQHETWDPKPDAIEEIRGPFRPIQTSVPGLMVGELMPRMAQQAHHWSVLRAVTTRDNAHSSSGYYMLTGVPHAPMNVENARPGAPNNWPSLAALVQKAKSAPGKMPASVVLPDHVWNDGNIPWPGQDAGFLGRAHDPWLLHCDPSEANFTAPSLTLPTEVPPLRFDHRQSLLTQVNRHLDTLDRDSNTASYQGQFQQALDLMRTGSVRRAFDLRDEPATMRDRYGRTRFGQSLLLARRLVEAGMPLVQINWTRLPGDAPNNGTWDTHAKNAESMKDWLMPITDRCVSALVDDLQTRGLLDETLVVWLAEFGRTPRHNGAGGRDHWGPVFSIALAGGGVQRGVVHGASDRNAAYPRDGAVQPQDLIATILHLMGIDPHTEIRDPQNRPIPLSRGDVIRQIV